jgi:hypothetical protein
MSWRIACAARDTTTSATMSSGNATSSRACTAGSRSSGTSTAEPVRVPSSAASTTNGTHVISTSSRMLRAGRTSSDEAAPTPRNARKISPPEASDTMAGCMGIH